jgi:uncharacterized protein (DUF58 family)
MRKPGIFIKVHRSGKIYVAVSIILGILAINSGNNFHYLAAASVLGYMAASGEAGKRNVRGASVTLLFPDEIYADTPFRLSVEVHNTRRFFSISILDVSMFGKSIFFPTIGPNESVKKSIILSMPSRGVAFPKEIAVSSVYPFNFFTCICSLPCKESVTIFPKPIRCQDGMIFADADAGESERASSLSRGLPSDAGVAGVRPYAEGDPLKIIHWKSSAKTGALKSRLYEDTPDSGGKIIDLDQLVARGVERGLSAASWEVCEAIKSGSPIGMKNGGILRDATSSRSDKLSMLKELALYE